MKVKIITMLCCLLVSSLTMQAQQLLSPSFGFSHKKTSYISLKDGTEITGTLKDIDRKKGLIDFVNIEDGEGKKHKLKPEKIKNMYLPPTAFDNMNKAADFVTSAQHWSKDKLDQDLIKQGYVYFENAKVKIKKKEMELLMQLLNPTFNEKVQVYHDPFAKESMSLGVGPVDIVGGNAKSYYVKVEGSKAAFRLYKKHYYKEFDGLWKKCPNVKKTYPNVNWMDLPKHIVAYNSCQ